ncbi:unnamed protein product [Cunninghamella echinulata]
MAVFDIQIIRRSITFYLSILLLNGLYIMMELARVTIPIPYDDILKYLMGINKILMILYVIKNHYKLLPRN